MQIVFHGIVERQDFLEYLVYLSRRLVSVSVIALIAVAIATTILLAGNQERIANDIVFVALLAGLLIGLVWYGPVLQSRRLPQNVYDDHFDFVIDDTGLRQKGVHSEMWTSWYLFHDVVELNKVFLFVQSRFVSYVVPKRFMSGDQVEQLREFIVARRKMKSQKPTTQT